MWMRLHFKELKLFYVIQDKNITYNVFFGTKLLKTVFMGQSGTTTLKEDIQKE